MQRCAFAPSSSNDSFAWLPKTTEQYVLAFAYSIIVATSLLLVIVGSMAALGEFEEHSFAHLDKLSQEEGMVLAGSGLFFTIATLFSLAQLCSTVPKPPLRTAEQRSTRLRSEEIDREIEDRDLDGEAPLSPITPMPSAPSTPPPGIARRDSLVMSPLNLDEAAQIERSAMERRRSSIQHRPIATIEQEIRGAEAAHQEAERELEDWEAAVQSGWITDADYPGDYCIKLPGIRNYQVITLGKDPLGFTLGISWNLKIRISKEGKPEIKVTTAPKEYSRTRMPYIKSSDPNIRRKMVLSRKMEANVRSRVQETARPLTILQAELRAAQGAVIE